ncbi:MAG: tetratricopeptide repeat protein, partial [Bacteroidota bacterium]
MMIVPFFGIAAGSSTERILSKADSLKSVGEPNQALELYLSLVNQTKDTTRAYIHQNVGDIYRNTNQFKEAYENYINAIKLTRENKVKASLNMKAGSVCGLLEQIDQALFHFNKALTISLEEEDDLLISQSYNNLGLAYLKILDYQKAKSLLIRSYVIRSKLNVTPFKMSFVSTNLGLIYEKLGDIDSANYYYQLSYKLIKSSKTDDYYLAQALQNLGYIKQLNRENDSAYWYYSEACKKVEGELYPGLSQKIYGNLFEYFWSVKEYDSVKLYLDKFTEVEKDLYDEVTGKEILDLNTRYQVSEKDLQIDQMGEENEQIASQRNLLIAGTFFLIVTFTLLILYLKQRQNSIRALAAQNEKILHQKIDEVLKDEEIKSINAMLEGQENERKRIAEDLHDRLGSKLAAVKLHFESIEELAKNSNTGGKLSVLIDEAVSDVRAIAHNMLSGVLDKFGLVAALNDLAETINSSGKLEVRFISHGIDNRLPGELELNLYRIIQELLANVLKHSKANEVDIQLNKFNDELVVTVEDNGVGFDKNQ